MEITLYSVVTTSVLGFVLLYAWLSLNWLWFRPKKLEKLLRQQGFTGNPYRLYYGDVKEMLMMSRQVKQTTISVSDNILPHVLPFHHHVIQKYGKSSFTWSGPLPRINIMEPELINEIMLKSNIFRKPKQSPLQKMLVAGLVTYEDEKWARHRRIMNPSFYLDRLKEMVPAMYLSCSEMISKWEELVTEKGSSELDVSPYLHSLTSDVISRTAFGSSYEEGKRIFELQMEQCVLLMKALRSLVPGWRFFPTKTKRRMKHVNDEVEALVRVMVDKREKAVKQSETPADNFLSSLIKANLTEQEENGKKEDAGIFIQEVVEECKLFFFAGQETTANLLVWTMVLLSQHQNWQLRARNEVTKVFGNSIPDYEGLNRLKIVTMILNEVLRLYPPSIMVMRVVDEETTLGKLVLPAGIRIIVPTVFVHRDPEIWGEDADEFKPERFAQGIAKATKKQLAFFPFGGGPRICIGNNFAMMEAKMAISVILRNFSFRSSPSYVHDPYFLLTLRPQGAVQMILQKL